MHYHEHTYPLLPLLPLHLVNSQYPGPAGTTRRMRDPLTENSYLARSSAMKSPMRTQLIPRRHWVITTAGCCDYVDSTGNNPCFPMFCPMAVLGTCCIAGRVQTQLTNEEPTSCEMGKNGWLTCCVGLPFVFFGPLGGYISHYMRHTPPLFHVAVPLWHCGTVALWHCGPTVLYINTPHASSTRLTH